jgi:hypothetical protein
MFTYFSTDDVIETIFTPVTVLPHDMYFALALPRELVTDWRAKHSFFCSVTVTLTLLAVSLWYCQCITIKAFTTHNKVSGILPAKYKGFC